MSEQSPKKENPGSMNAPAFQPASDDVEIQGMPSLSGGQEVLVDLHSVINLISVLSSCFELLQDRGFFPMDSLRENVRSLLSEIRTATDVGNSPRFDPSWPKKIEEEFEDVVRSNLDGSADTVELIDTVRSVLGIFKIRLEEILARLEAPEEWKVFCTRELSESIEQVLAAIEQNAHGKYRIVRNIAEQSPNDYQVDLQITSDGGETLVMPPVLQDVLRDLIANARKYTQPGGKISAGIHSGRDGLRLVVEDNGLGIPEDEIERVVEFGYRASNTSSKPTMGGGFGLTKAWWVTKKFGGRMWIRSMPERGTRITICLPPAPTP
jgi:signal transduction histidine kinase